MLNVKHRTRPQFGLRTVTVLSLCACLGWQAAVSQPIFPRALDVTSETDLLPAGGRDDPADYVWLELDEFASEISAAPADGTDLLQKLRSGFTLDPVMNSRVEAELKWFVKHPEYLERVFSRAQRYLPFIVSELESRDLPYELALLPVVESAFDPFAYSHGRAAGLWQMIPGTARRFGVTQNWWYDGRRDAIDSTLAALDYLEYLHGLMDGDWHHAIASYNSGEGNVLKAVKRNRAKQKPTDYWNLSLSRETSAYVPRLLALVELVRDPDAYGVSLPALVDEPQFVVADVGGQLDLALAAELAGIELDLLYSHNAGNNRWATDPEGPHRLVLPVEAAETFITALQELPVEERVRWQRHKVKNGEAISQIAERYNVTIATIKSVNQLSGNTIRAGAYLMIPVATKPLSAYGQSADERLARKQNTAREGTRVEHKVASGESFWSISRRYNVDMMKLAAWNGMAPRDTLSIGQKLVVWTKSAVSVSTQTGNATTRKLNYTVRSGDSLYLIANRFRISVNDLVRWNSIDKNKILRPGQKLTMYVDVTTQSG